ncbi:hypothetical protein D9611_010228 [Ephemerocybe angulata]|uniref:NAD(P)-binding protein n=1 Tax=Ephemerocybe angulata TaxID=980116 RepID=A0A8H5EVJ6_9AGAR|nr:hypothetical protein D9611_010228 [Tulosesus angulatus]
MPSIAAIRALNLSRVPSTYIPVGVFVGGTSGIGQGMAEAFARMTKGRANIVIVGRNQTAAEAIIAKLPQAAESKYEFVKCDATLMRNVEAASKEIMAKHSKINFLVMSPGFFSLKGFDASEEGIDRKLATHYYARWKFVDGLLPALKSAKAAGEDAKVLSVLGAGYGGPIDIDDLGLKKTFSLSNAAKAAATYNDLMMEEYAERNPELTFSHSSPGAVATNIASSAQSATMRFFAPVMNVAAKVLATSPADCAEYMWHGIFSNTTGAFRIGSRGEEIGKKDYFGDEEQRKALWEHTEKEVRTSSS